MASSRRAEEIFLASLLLHICVLFHGCGGSCPQQGSKTPVLGDKVEGSEVVVQGQVIQKVNVKDRSYTVDLQVLCVYKGGPLPSRIRIIDAGEAPESCVKTDFPQNSIRLAYLKRTGELFAPVFTEDPAERKYLDELQFVCGLTVQLPIGTSIPNAYCNPQGFEMYDYCGDDTTPAGTAKSTIVSLSLLSSAVMLSLLLGKIAL